MVPSRLRRTTDAEEINRIANDPSVRPHVGFAEAGYIDSTALLAMPGVMAFSTGNAAFVYTPAPDGALEIHSMALPAVRGPLTVAAVRESLDIVFALGAPLVVTRVAPENRAAFGLARICGFSICGRDKHDILMRLPREKWAARRKSREDSEVSVETA